VEASVARVTVEQVRHLRESTIGNLEQTHTLHGVGLRLGERRLVGLEAIHQRKTGSIVGTGVDLRSG